MDLFSVVVFFPFLKDQLGFLVLQNTISVYSDYSAGYLHQEDSAWFSAAFPTSSVCAVWLCVSAIVYTYLKNNRSGVNNSNVHC